MPKSSLPLFAAIALPALLFAGSLSPAQAQSKFGRLSDGRAYRVDENGYQLIDHIAELEVGNDELRRQVATLEAELDDKGAPAPKAAASGDVPNCNELVSSLYLKISKLERQNTDPSRLPPAQVCDYESAQNPLWKQIQALEQKLSAAAPQAAECNFQSPQNPLFEQVQALKQQVAERDSRIAKLNETSETSNQRARLESPVAARGSETAAAEESTSPENGTNGPESIRIAKRELQGKLKEIEQLITARKSAYDRLKDQHATVTVSISPLRTTSGVSLDTYRTRIGSFGPRSDREEIGRGLDEITALLKEDLNVLQRLLKL